MNNRPLQHEIKAVLRSGRTRPQLQGVAGEELEGAIKETLEAAWTECGVRDAGERRRRIGDQDRGLGSRDACTALDGMIQKSRWQVAYSAGVGLGIAEGEAGGGRGARELEGKR